VFPPCNSVVKFFFLFPFSADSTSSDIERIFPSSGVSPVLDYADSTVAWPGENEGMMIASKAGTHYLVVLYSKAVFGLLLAIDHSAR